MTRTVLEGLNGSNPLGFMAAVGLLRLLRTAESSPRLAFRADGSFYPFIDTGCEDLPGLVAGDAAASGRDAGWWLEYEKVEKRGSKTVADLKAPPDRFATFLHDCLDRWTRGDGEGAAYAAAFGTSEARDGKGNTKPTAFHFTAANMQFLEIVELIRGAVTAEWASESLFLGHATRPGSNLRWDPSAERSWALMAKDPTADGTRVDAPLEWLAFRALPLFPTMPDATSRVLTTAVSRHGPDTCFAWPLWEVPATLETVRSLLRLPIDGPPQTRRARGIFAVCSSTIRRTGQGFGSFAPAAVTT